MHLDDTRMSEQDHSFAAPVVKNQKPLKQSKLFFNFSANKSPSTSKQDQKQDPKDKDHKLDQAIISHSDLNLGVQTSINEMSE